MHDPLLTTAEAALLLGVARQTIGGWARAGLVEPAGTRGAAYVYRESDLYRAQLQVRFAKRAAGPGQQPTPPRVVFVPISVAWAFTVAEGWHVIEDPRSAIDMDRLCDQYDEAETRQMMVAGR